MRGSHLYCWSEDRTVLIADVDTGMIIHEIQLGPLLSSRSHDHCLGSAVGWGGLNLQVDPTARYIFVFNRRMYPFRAIYDIFSNSWIKHDWLNRCQGHISSNPFSPDGTLFCQALNVESPSDITFGIFRVDAGNQVATILGTCETEENGCKRDDEFENDYEDEYIEEYSEDYEDEHNAQRRRHFYGIVPQEIGCCVFGFYSNPDYNFNILYESYAQECRDILKTSLFCKKSLTENYCIVDGLGGDYLTHMGPIVTVLHKQKVLAPFPIAPAVDPVQYQTIFSNSEEYLAVIPRDSYDRTSGLIQIRQLPSLSVISYI
ncbi:MAG: hypothetical protein ACYDHW_06245, partial [Syntrophorhabdaceae bacterium]